MEKIDLCDHAIKKRNVELVKKHMYASFRDERVQGESFIQE